MRRVEKGEERRMAAVRGDTILIAVADFCFAQGELSGGQVKISKWHRSGTHFCKKCWHCFGPEKPQLHSPGGQAIRGHFSFS